MNIYTSHSPFSRAHSFPSYSSPREMTISGNYNNVDLPQQLDCLIITGSNNTIRISGFINKMVISGNNNQIMIPFDPQQLVINGRNNQLISQSAHRNLLPVQNQGPHNFYDPVERRMNEVRAELGTNDPAIVRSNLFKTNLPNYQTTLGSFSQQQAPPNFRSALSNSDSFSTSFLQRGNGGSPIGPSPFSRMMGNCSSQVRQSGPMQPAWDSEPAQSGSGNLFPESIFERRQNQEHQSCSICLEEFEHRVTKVKTISCFHNFHSECIDRWLQTSKQCPLCKFDVC